MSTLLMKHGHGYHAIMVEDTAEQLEARLHGRFTHPVDWPDLWHPGDMVSVVTSDSLTYTGMAIDVSALTSAVLIELEAP